MVDTHGFLVYFERMDNTQAASMDIAVGVSGVTGDQDEQCAKAGLGS